MGIRVNKSLGWVFYGKKLNLEILKNLTLLDLKNEFKTDFEISNLDLSFQGIDLSKKLIEFVNDVSDQDTPNDFLYIFSPPFINKDWNRHDDSIDYHECNDGNRTIKYIHRDVFPYSQKFVVSRSLKELTDIQKRHCLYFSENQDLLSDKIKENLSNIGIDIKKPLISQIHMTCPKIIKAIFEKCSDENYKSLQPAIVTYWR